MDSSRSETCPVQILNDTTCRIIAKIFAALVVMAAILPQVAHAEEFNIENIRVAKNGQVTRIVFDTNKIPTYKIFTLNNPGRVVIDLSNAKLATNVDQSVFNASFVEKLRHANRAQNKLRIVLDLNQKIIPKSFVLPPNGNSHHRLVIDLKNAQDTSTIMVSKPKPATKKVVAKASKPVKATKQAPKKVVAKVEKKPTPKVAANKTTKPKKKIITPSVAKKAKKAREIIVAIDPGHGGKDPGAIGYAGTREKDVVLKISKRLARLINAEPGMRAIMTRQSDDFITLRGRMKKARSKNADIFISVHADAVDDRRVRGSSVYVLSKHGASSEAARILAKRHNQPDVIGGVKLDGKDKNLTKTLVDLSQHATTKESNKLASALHRQLGKIGKTRKLGRAPFAVLKSPDIPSVLVETAFISNASEEKKLRSATHQQKLAVSILKGIKTYLSSNAPENSIIANRSKLDKHTIKYGETLSGIAVRYSVSIDSLRKTNALRTDRIRVGQKLIIPGV